MTTKHLISAIVAGGTLAFSMGVLAQALHVAPSGNVGIGTYTPETQLHVVNGTSPTLRLEQNVSNGLLPQTWDVVGDATSFSILDATNNTSPFRIRPGAPSSAIDIQADGDVYLSGNNSMELRLNSSDGPGNYGELTFQRAGVDEWSFGDTNSFFYIYNYTAGHEHDAISINTMTGNVNFAHDLTITGHCTDVDGPCAPDYVFEPDYELRSIQDLAAFVAENKHLPNVPSAAQIDSNGVNMRSFSFALLEKIEELVLYTVSQQASIDQLQSENRELRASQSQLLTNQQKQLAAYTELKAMLIDLQMQSQSRNLLTRLD